MRYQAIETIIDGNFKLEIFQDDNTDSPMEWGWPVTLIRTRYKLEDDLRETIREHGNIWYSEISTQERGYLYVTASKAEWITSMKKGEKDSAYHGWESTKAGMQKMVDGMADTMKQYYDGDVYGYTISVNRSSDCPCEDWEQLDGCWGYYGIEDVLKEGKSVMAGIIETEKQAIEFDRNGMAI